MSVLPGKKTYIAGSMLILTGLYGLANCIIGFDSAPCDPSAAIKALAEGLGFVGVRVALS